MAHSKLASGTILGKASCCRILELSKCVPRAGEAARMNSEESHTCHRLEALRSGRRA